MALSKKRNLSDSERREIQGFLSAGVSLGRLARKFGVNKPRILKTVGKWFGKPKPWKYDKEGNRVNL